MKKKLFANALFLSMALLTTSCNLGDVQIIVQSSEQQSVSSVDSGSASNDSSKEDQNSTASEVSSVGDQSEQPQVSEDESSQASVQPSEASEAEPVESTSAESSVAPQESSAAPQESSAAPQESSEIEVVPDPGAEENCIVKEDTEIIMWSTFNTTYQAFLDNAAISLRKHEPHIKVTIVKQGANYSGLKDMIVNGFAANNYPDLAPAYPDSVNDFIDAMKALDIGKYMNNKNYGWTEDDLNDIYPAYLEEGSSYSIPGTYSLPLAKSTEAMFYDRRVLKVDLSQIDNTINNGKPISEDYLNNLTWEEMFDHLCPALLTYNDQLIAAGKTPLIDKNVESLNGLYSVIGYDSDDNLFITLAEQYGLGYTSVNTNLGVGSLDFVEKGSDGRFSGVSEGYRNLMKKFNDAYLKHYIVTQGTYGGYTSKLSNSNACLFSIGSTGGTSNQFSESNPKDIGVANIPHAEGRKLKVINQGPSMAFLNHKDENRAIASWLFYKEFTQGVFPIAWSTTTGYSPIRKSVAESDDYMDFSDPDQFDAATTDILMARASVYSGSVGPYLFTSPVFTGSSTARSEVGGLMQNCLTNGEDKGVLTDENLLKFFKTAYDNTVLKMR